MLVVKIYTAGNKDWKENFKKAIFQFNEDTGLGFSMYILNEEGMQRVQFILND